MATPNVSGGTVPASNAASATTAAGGPAAGAQNTGPSPGPGANSGAGGVDRDQIYQWILELSSPDTRETALLELSKKREVVPDLAPMLWNSFGTIAALLQEINHIYPAINPPTLSAHQSQLLCSIK